MSNGGNIQFNYNSQFGSGSGGSIQIYSIYMNGSGQIQANGGFIINNQNGGLGGGGRIRFFFNLSSMVNEISRFQSRDISQILEKFDTLHPVLVQVKPGMSVSSFTGKVEGPVSADNTIGSALSTPCPPGFYHADQIYFCKRCPPGTYKNSLLPGGCLPCFPKTKNSQYYDQSTAINV